MLLPTGALPRARLSQLLVLTAFLGFQTLDLITTHLGLGRQHVEMNQVMAPVIAVHGELVAYAIKATAIAILLAVLMLLQRQKPRVWTAYLLAAWLSAGAVLLNVMQLL